MLLGGGPPVRRPAGGENRNRPLLARRRGVLGRPHHGEYKKLNAHFGRLPKMKAELDRLRTEVAALKESRQPTEDE